MSGRLRLSHGCSRHQWVGPGMLLSPRSARDAPTESDLPGCLQHGITGGWWRGDLS